MSQALECQVIKNQVVIYMMQKDQYQNRYQFGMIALCGNERDRSYNDYTLTSKRFDYMLSRFDFANWTEFKIKTNSSFEV